MRHVRLQPDHVADKLALVALVVAHLAGPVEQLDAGHPFVDGEFVLAREVMHMADQAGHDLPEARVGLGTHRVDDIVGEVGVKPMSSHD